MGKKKVRRVDSRLDDVSGALYELTRYMAYNEASRLGAFNDYGLVCADDLAKKYGVV